MFWKCLEAFRHISVLSNRSDLVGGPLAGREAQGRKSPKERTL